MLSCVFLIIAHVLIAIAIRIGSSLLMLHKDFLMAEFEFMYVKITFDGKLKVVKLAGDNKRRSWNNGLSQIVASSASKMKHLVAAVSDEAYTLWALATI